MRGVRVFDGRHYLLTNRGPRAQMEREAQELRAGGRWYARVVPWDPFDPKQLRDTLDDYALFTFPRAARR